MTNIKWFVYIPEEGDWPISYKGRDKASARKAYLRWARRKILPRGAKVWSMEVDRRTR